MSSNNKRARESETPAEGKKSKSETSAAKQQPAASSTPAWGCQTSIGKREYQEDAHLVNQRVSTSDTTEASIFAVFDGHGGRNVSEFLAHNAQQFVQAALLSESRCQAAALRSAYLKMDASLPESDIQAGSTALLVVMNDSTIVCANCGDSRAVLCRGGEAVALSNDHKPDREDEEARIQKAGGHIINNGGARRVMGVLSMSRAIGDTWLQQYGVTPEPEVKIVERQPGDELLILASDGLWDALSNQEAAVVARRCLQRASSKGASRKAAANIAAKVLIRAATDRGSRDNITVIVIDLQAPSSPELDDTPSPSSSQPGSLPYPAAPAIRRRHSDPSRSLVDQGCKGSSADVSVWMPRLLSAERLLLVSASSAPPSLLVLAA